MTKKIYILLGTWFLLSSLNVLGANKNVVDSPLEQFGKISEMDIRARTDNLFVAIEHNKNFLGYVIHYRGKNSIPYELSGLPWTLGVIKEHFKFRNFDENRVRFVVAQNIEENERTTFWLISKEYEKKTGSDGYPKQPLSKEKTFLFDKSTLNLKGAGFELESILEKPKVKFNKDFLEAKKYFEGLSEEEKEEVLNIWTETFFGKLLKQESDLKGIIVFYADKDYFDIEKLTVMIKRGRKKVQVKYKLSPSKLQIFYGGFRNEPEIELWMMPKGGKFPEITADSKQK